MKKILYIFFFLIGTFHFGQGTSENRFEESEKGSSAFNPNKDVESETLGDPPNDADSPGNPGDPTPIDDYIPLLILAALGIIIYKTRKNRNLLS